ncbi:hypothetical protein DSO57_1014762 [Entomophthora muscae]|uniref:Uncharacterized protein n=2 Tax=Entomophthora muscae TaxID=34485 RepID=A0ACC2TGH9_9FUNG|nr:hypothetical protein DSO57_1014762 [Entomophthora muscae]
MSFAAWRSVRVTKANIKHCRSLRFTRSIASEASETSLNDMDRITNIFKGLGSASDDTPDRSSYWNKGSAFTATERQDQKLCGLIPSSVENLELQEERAMLGLRRQSKPLDKYMFLSHIRNSNVRLFYSLVIKHFKEIAPLIYTPVVGEACQEYSHIQPFLGATGNPDGLFISLNDLDSLDTLLENYRLALPPPHSNPEIAVITDGSRILGLGDLGVNGMGIPVGKLQLYVGAAGINPSKTLPIALDFGTNTQSILDDPLYLGLRQKRPSEEEFYAATDKVLNAVRRKFPGILIQFEDFSSEHAFGLLEKYQNEIFCFNDDIQGTGAVILSGFINAVRLSETPAKDQRIVFLGAGSAGIGVSRQIMDYFIHDGGLTEDEAREKFWLIDSKGLITMDRGDKLSSQKSFFARKDNSGVQYKSLIEVLDYVKPTALIGLSSISGAFSEEALRKMAEINNRPIVFPLSNPATNAECTFEQAMKATNNKVIFASGTAFPDYKDEASGVVFHPGQGNNMYIFPGLGFGALLCKSGKVTDKMIYAAAASLADALTPEEIEQNLLYPDLDRIRPVSARVAAATILQAHKEGLVQIPEILAATTSLETMTAFVEKNMWHPAYPSNLTQAVEHEKQSVSSL